jgi:hypothetical protein
VLLNFLDNGGAFLTEPVAATSVEEVAERKAELDAFKKELASRDPEYQALQALAPSVKDGALIDDVKAKWNETQELVAKREAALADETTKQQNNEQLRKQFAQTAQKFQGTLAPLHIALSLSNPSMLSAAPRRLVERPVGEACRHERRSRGAAKVARCVGQRERRRCRAARHRQRCRSTTRCCRRYVALLTRHCWSRSISFAPCL